MKKILFTARDLKLGGIEKALVMLLNYLSEENDITLVLEKKEGVLLSELDSKIKIEEYTPAKNKIKIIRKIENMCKRIGAIFKYKNKYDVSISFATYSIPGSFIARLASQNSILWGHADYLSLFDNDETQMKNFFEDIKYKKFLKIIFVAKSAKESFLKVFPEKENSTYYCNNLIDAEIIKKESNEEIELKRDDNLITFLNVGRHDEKQKKLTRIIEASNKLKEEGYQFRVVFVGDGENSDMYKKLVQKKDLEDYIVFEGAKKNPYPYFKVSDCVVMSSDYEGYPVVFLESFILNKPIITTKVSDFQDVENGRGIVCEKTVDGIYEGMKSFIDIGYTIKNAFNFNDENNRTKATIKDILS